VADYKFLAVRDGDILGEIAALERSMSLRLREPSSVSFRVNGEHPTAKLIREFDTDILVYRGTDPVFRGTVGAVNDTGDGTGYYMRVSAVDYRGRLERRVLKADAPFVGQDDTAIVTSLIGTVQGEVRGSMGLTVAGDTDPVARTVTFPAGETVAEAIDLLASLEGGFDWDVEPDLTLRTFRPRGRNRGRVLDYGGALSGFAVSGDPRAFSNVVRVSGSGVAAAVRSDLSVFRRRFETQIGLPLVDEQAVVDDFADRALEDGLGGWQTWELRLRQSNAIQAWGGLGDIGLGDTVRVVVRIGRLDVNELQRVQQITVLLDEDGREDVLLATRGRRREFTDRFREVNRRLSALELG
jgi:hypothetical protein